jgi:hypothetical protein
MKLRRVASGHATLVILKYSLGFGVVETLMKMAVDEITNDANETATLCGQVYPHLRS